MPYLIGADEAGYGPNLGPLVIGATLWRVAGEPRACDLYEVLRGIVVRSAAEATAGALAIADSKLLYKSGQSVRLLERGVLSALAAIGPPMASARELFRVLDLDAFEQFDVLPWHAHRNLALPREHTAEELARCAASLAKGMRLSGVELVALRACIVFPSQFNTLTDECGSKGEALSRLTLGLVGKLLKSYGDEPTLVVCDKHGGRGKYQRLLQEEFPDPLIEILREGRGESVYRWGLSPGRVEICFRAKGESFLPAALASMTAKYLRELAMHLFNEYWGEQIDGLKPTAGYPVDAQRFKAEIAPAQLALGIDDEILWRRR